MNATKEDIEKVLNSIWRELAEIETQETRSTREEIRHKNLKETERILLKQLGKLETL